VNRDSAFENRFVVRRPHSSGFIFLRDLQDDEPVFCSRIEQAWLFRKLNDAIQVAELFEAEVGRVLFNAQNHVVKTALMR